MRGAMAPRCSNSGSVKIAKKSPQYVHIVVKPLRTRRGLSRAFLFFLVLSSIPQTFVQRNDWNRNTTILTQKGETRNRNSRHTNVEQPLFFLYENCSLDDIPPGVLALV